MSLNNISIVYMGTPEFAVAPLQLLLNNKYNIKAVVTAVDKPAGRGGKLAISNVKQFALDNNLSLLQPTNLKDPEFIDTLKSLNADLYIVVAFRMLPKQVWQIPKLGTINLHASLLPNYRGAAPINHALINGEERTGLTTFFINDDIDTGNIIMQQDCEISETDAFGSLSQKLQTIGAELVVKTLDEIIAGKVSEIKQSSLITENTILYDAPKLSKDFCKIDFSKDVLSIHNFIRGLSPYPAAWCKISFAENLNFKIFETSFNLEQHNEEIGKVISDNKSFLKIACIDGFLSIKDIQMSGKKRLSIKDFLNGFKFKGDELFL